MITKNTYYKNEIYIPHAKPSITSDVTTVSADLEYFIDEYETECLIKCLGLPLATEFIATLDVSKTNGLKDGVDNKWNDLLNGKTYTDQNGDTIQWKGIRRLSNPADTEPSKSFLANYVFYHYEQNYDVFRTGVGHVKPKGANTEERSPTQKVIKAWRDMVDIIQGREFKSEVIVKSFGLGVDYYHTNEDKTLYQFIRDMNYATPDTYADFRPGYWEVRTNQFGL